MLSRKSAIGLREIYKFLSHLGEELFGAEMADDEIAAVNDDSLGLEERESSNEEIDDWSNEEGSSVEIDVSEDSLSDAAFLIAAMDLRTFSECMLKYFSISCLV